MSKKNANFRNTNSVGNGTVLGGTASGPPVPPMGYLAASFHRGDERFQSERITKPTQPAVYNSSTAPTVPVLSFRNTKGERRAGKARRDQPEVDPDQPGGVIIHVNDPPTDMPKELSPEEASELLETQSATQMGYDIMSVDELTPEKKNALYELLFVNGGYVFYALFIARTQRYVLPVMTFAIASFLFWVSLAVVAALVIVAQVDIDLWLFTIITVAFMAFIPFTAFAVSVLEFSRKNTDLSIWHKTRIFMPLVVTIIAGFAAIVCLAVHNKQSGSVINRHEIDSYSSLSFCFVLIFVVPIFIGRELVPAIVSTIYPECQGPTTITLAPDTVRRIRNDAERAARGGFGSPKNV
jgi:hypothetical protein